MRLKKEDGRSKVKVLSLSFSLSPTNFQIVFGCYKTAEPDLSLSHLPYGKDIRMENWGKRKKKKKGEPLYMLQSWAARDGQLRKSCVPYDV
jgi:hypothetical protein